MVPVVRLKFFQKYLTEIVKYGIFKITINLTKVVGYKDRRSQNSDRRGFLTPQDRNVPPIQRNSFVTGYIL